jgi:hypothetical protein
MSKLTLHVPEDLVTAAKSEAAARRVSVSKLVSDFFASLAANKPAVDCETGRLAPRTRRLAGCVSRTDTDMEDYIDHLEEKHS